MKILGGILSLAVFLLPVSVEAKKDPWVGDEDPFPLQCVDFSGHWAADNGTRYTIQQTDCKFLKIVMLWKNLGQDTISIVPDNVNRSIPGRERSAVRHRWNSNRMGSIIESHITYVQDRARVSEVVMYERANAGLLLETTYTTVESLDHPGLVERDYGQQVFRRLGRQDKPFERKRAR